MKPEFGYSYNYKLSCKMQERSTSILHQMSALCNQIFISVTITRQAVRCVIISLLHVLVVPRVILAQIFYLELC
jgi:hypothetical protein